MKSALLFSAFFVWSSIFVGCGVQRVPGQPGVRGPGGSYRLHRSVVLDFATETLLIASPQGSVAALDATSGDVRWTSPKAVAALVSRGNAVLAIGKGAAGFAVLNLEGGEVLRTCAANASLSFGDGLGSSSDVQALMVGEKAIVQTIWSTFYSGGAAPTAEMEAAARSSGLAMLDVDLATCTVKPASDEQTSQFHKGAAAPTGGSVPYTLGTLQVAIRSEASGNDTTIVLARSRQGTTLAPVELVKSRDGYLYIAVAVDGRHIWVANQIPQGTPIRYKSRVFDIYTGAVIGEFTTEMFPNSFYMAGGEILVSIRNSTAPQKDANLGAPLGIGGTSISKGSELWWHEILDPTYRGPYPP